MLSLTFARGSCIQSVAEVLFQSMNKCGFSRELRLILPFTLISEKTPQQQSCMSGLQSFVNDGSSFAGWMIVFEYQNLLCSVVCAIHNLLVRGTF